MQRLQVGDSVVVVGGAHKGSTGTIKRVLLKADRVVVEGVNFVKRHVKASPQNAGGILRQEAPIHVSNVMLVDPETSKPTRVKHEVRDGKKVRVAKSGAVIPTAK